MGHIFREFREIRTLLLLFSCFSCLWSSGCGEDAPSPPSPPSSKPPPPSGVRCDEPEWQIGACMSGESDFEENLSASHIDEGSLSYSQDPPSSGDHRSVWARWGEYTFLPPERWLHNLEHGGVVFLYHPCIEAEILDELRDYIRELRDEEGTPLRWILTPASSLQTGIAVIAWEWRYFANCIRGEEIEDFIRRNYRQAPEDIAADGAYLEGWVGFWF